MFEIGDSLREARVRRGIDFAEAELATKIRGKYLRALEDEQFELLPAQTYVKGFLRTYAEYLGLDGQLYVDEFNSRFVSGLDDHELRVRRSAARPQRRTARRVETNVVLIVLAAIAVITVIVISAWKASGGSHSPSATKTGTTAPTTAAKAPAPLLALTALHGSTTVTARRGSATGRIVFDGTISQGDPTRAIRGSLLWVSISSPDNVRIQVRGKLVHVPGTQPQVIFVTPTGWRPA